VIKRLRQALEDSAEDPKFIETLPRRGYRFLLAVEQAASGAAAVPPDLDAPYDELAGKTISRYRILRKLGHGAMGIVYEAEDTKLGRSVALKFLAEEFSDDLQALERFEREARAASALNHPNIVSVYDIGREKDTYWIVTELVQGETLCQLIAHGPLTVRKTIEIVVQVANGLASAHRAGIVHRDLKPSNIIVSPDGYVKIIDFGLATQGPVHTDSSAPDLTNEGAVLGTAGYMSPEQIRGQTADNRSDIFSFGVILHEMLAGKRAFSGSSSVEAMNAILKDDPPALPQSVALSLDRIVRRCLEKEPARRFQSAADLEFALVALSGSQGLPVQPPRQSIRKRLAWAAATLALTAGASVTMAFWRRSVDSLPPQQIAYSGQDS
jgi:serine/threonine protein kinase